MYPYIFKPSKKSLNYKEIFVVMPFDEKYNPIFTDLIVPAARKASALLGLGSGDQFTPYRTKDDIRTTSGWINVLEHLFTAQIVLGVLTDNKVNVFYELGIAHATQQISRQILIANKEYNPPFDTKDLIYLPYEDDLDKSTGPLAGKIADAINWFKIEEDRTVTEAKKQLGVNELEIIMTQNSKRAFTMHTSDQGRDDYENELLNRIGKQHTHLKGCFYRQPEGRVNNLKFLNSIRYCKAMD